MRPQNENVSILVYPSPVCMTNMGILSAYSSMDGCYGHRISHIILLHITQKQKWLLVTCFNATCTLGYIFTYRCGHDDMGVLNLKEVGDLCVSGQLLAAQAQRLEFLLPVLKALAA